MKNKEEVQNAVTLPEEKPLEVTEKAPRVKLEILVYGTEKSKPKIKKMMDDLQIQIDKHKKGSYARILWYIDKGEKTDDEKKLWLSENCNSKFYIFAETTYAIKPNFITDCLKKINVAENALLALKTQGIIANKNKPVSQITTQVDTAKQMTVVKD